MTTDDLLDTRRHPTLSVEQAAQVYGVSRSTAYELVRCGAVPSIRLSPRRIVIPTAALRVSLGMPPESGP